MKQNMRMMIRKRGAFLTVLLLVMGILAGCAGSGEQPGQDSATDFTQTTETNNMSDDNKNDQEPVPPLSDAIRLGYVIVTDTIRADGKTDVTKALQELIDTNPNRTLYFPDGTYLISDSIRTPADPAFSVSLVLSNYAVIKADQKKWFSDEAMIRLGGKIPSSDSHQVGSNYSFTGGVIDGSGVANGISIDSGRETAVQNVSIKNTLIGLHIKHGANNGSSDADISNINIYGNGKPQSKGILIEGFDNTITNVRIGYVQVGVHIKSSANSLRNIHPLYHLDYSDYETSYGFWDEAGTNWYDFCYSDHFRVAFRLGANVCSYFNNCFTFWYDDGGAGANQTATAFLSDGIFASYVVGFKASFRKDRAACMLKEGDAGGSGMFERIVILNAGQMEPSDAYFKYLVNKGVS